MLRLLTRSVFGCTALCCLSVFQQAHGDVTLKHQPNYAVNQNIVTENSSTVSQTLTINGSDIETKADTFAKTRDIVQSVSADEVVVTSKMEAFQIDLELPGGQKVNFDLGNPDADVPAGPIGELVKFYKSLGNAKSKTVFGPDRKVKSIEYVDNSFQAVPDSFKGDVGPEQMKSQANQTLSRLPGRSVAPGETWTLSEVQNLGSGQVFKVVREFTYVGPEEHGGKTLEHITYQTKSVEFEIEATSTLPLTSKDSNLSVKSSEGHLWFDADAKRVVETEETFTVAGELTLVANNVELPTKLDLTMHQLSKVSVE